MSASVSGLARKLVCAIAVAATLLAAAPAAWADDTGGPGLSPTTVDAPSGYGNNVGGGAFTPPPNPVDTTALVNNSQPTAPQDNSATNTQSTSTTGGNGGTATGGNAGPSQVAGDGSQSGSHGGNAYANGGNAKSHSSLENTQSNRTSGRDRSGTGYRGDDKNDWGGRDSFGLETAKQRDPGGAAVQTIHVRFPGLFGLDAASRATRLEAREQRGHETTKATPLGGGLPGHGGRLPSQNPFFNLLSGSGGAGAGLMLLLLAVLGASIALPNQRSKAFRTPAGPWRPLAYVPPIELPG